MPFWVELHREWLLYPTGNSSFKSGGDDRWLPQSQPQPFCHYWVGKEVRRGLRVPHLCSWCQHTFHPLAIPSVPGGRGAGQDPVIPSVPRGRGADTEETSWGLPSGFHFDSALLPPLATCWSPPAGPQQRVLYQEGFSKGVKGQSDTKSVSARQGNWESLRLDPRKATEGWPGRMWNSPSKICARWCSPKE